MFSREPFEVTGTHDRVRLVNVLIIAHFPQKSMIYALSAHPGGHFALDSPD